MPPFGPLLPLDEVASEQFHASPTALAFRDPTTFLAGEIHQHLPFWSKILADYPKRDEILTYIKDHVDVFSFFHPFSGVFEGKHYSSSLPPPAIFPNSRSCKGFEDFITSTILERLRNGSLIAIGKTTEVSPPHLVMPLTIEPTKPRLCHDERFLNLWIRDLPFSLDKITDLPRYVGKNHYQTVMDDKSGYDHVLFTESSQTYFGLQWQGWYFCYRSIPFGWKSSAYLYHTIGLSATSYARSLGVPCSQYIDDRHAGQLHPRTSQPRSTSSSNYILAESATYILCFLLIHLGYFIGLKKSLLVPQLSVPYLGFISDSAQQAFRLPLEKKKKFLDLLEEVLKKKTVSLRTLQKLAGKTTSLSLAVPGARLYTSCIFQAISRAIFRGRPVPLSGDLLREIQTWRFLHSWDGFLPWRPEFHAHVTLSSDASNTGWGGIIHHPHNSPTTVRGIWSASDRSSLIVVREARALLNTLTASATMLRNCRVDCFVDNMPFLQAWNKSSSRNEALASVLKDIFLLTLYFNIHLVLHYIPSKDNPSDIPSRILSDIDCTLAPHIWHRIQTVFGPHTVDLMAIPANVLPDPSGRPLKFFSPFPVLDSAGANVFSQQLMCENAYVFPPFVLIGPLFKHLRTQRCPFSMVVPDLCPRRYWWPLLQQYASSSFLLGKKGAINVLLFPSKYGPPFQTRPLQWDLWVFRVPQF